MVCSDERNNEYPFDIQHKHIIIYKSESPSDFETLKSKIRTKFEAYLDTSKVKEDLRSSPIIPKNGLEAYEIAMLILILENTLSPEDGYSIYHLKNDMIDLGYTRGASGIAIRLLVKKRMVEIDYIEDGWNNGERIEICKLTSVGEKWIIENRDLIKIIQPEDKTAVEEIENFDNDVPF